MTDTTLPTLIAELEEALEAASPGPWRCQMDKNNHRCLIAYDDTWSKDLTLGAVWSSLHDEPPPNARLIALMRNSLPTLLEALTASQARAEALLNPDPWRPQTPVPSVQAIRDVADIYRYQMGSILHTEITNAADFVEEIATHFRELKGPGQ